MRKRTKRKHYNLINPILHAIEGAAVTSEADLDAMRVREREAMASLRAGTARPFDLDEVESMCLTSLEMADRGIGPEVIVSAKLLGIELRQARERFARTGRIALTGPALHAMADVWEYHDLQRQSIPRSLYEECILKVVNRLRTGR